MLPLVHSSMVKKHRVVFLVYLISGYFYFFLLINGLSYLEQLQVYENFEHLYRVLMYSSSQLQLSYFHIVNQLCTFVTLQLMSQQVYSLCCPVCGFCQMHNAIYSIFQYQTEQFYCPKSPLYSIYSSFLPSPSSLATTKLLPFAFSRRSCSWNHAVYSLFRLLSFISNMRFRFFFVFSWFDSSFFCIDEQNISPYGRSILISHLPIEEHLGCFQLWQL